MSNSKTDYNTYVRANLPSGMTFDSVRAKYLYNNHAFPTFWLASWYYDYINKFFNAESGLTLTSSIAPSASIPSATYANTSPAVLAMDIQGLDGSSGGLIFEHGGTGNGSYVGFTSGGDFIIQCGVGDVIPDTDVGYVVVDAASAPSGTGTLVVELKVLPCRVRVWWNGVEIGTPVDAVVSRSSWTGVSSGSYATSSSSAVAGGNISTVVNLTTISDLRYYGNQTVNT